MLTKEEAYQLHEDIYHALATRKIHDNLDLKNVLAKYTMNKCDSCGNVFTQIEKNIKKYYKFDSVIENGKEQLRKLDEAFEEIAQREKNAAV